jgi:hypothetical protein
MVEAPQRNDAAKSIHLPLSKRFPSSRHALKHGRDRKHNLQFSPNNVHVIAFDHVGRNITHVDRQALSHTQLQCWSIRQQSIETYELKLIQPLIATGYFPAYTNVTVSARAAPFARTTRAAEANIAPQSRRPAPHMRAEN